MNQNENIKNDHLLIYTLSKFSLMFLFFFYFLGVVIGLSFSINTIIYMTETLSHTTSTIIVSTIKNSIYISFMLACVRYVKVLYKAAIDERINFPMALFSGKEIGNFIFFIFRPFFASTFSLIMVICVLSGFFIATDSTVQVINHRFFYLCAIFSSFIGFSTGKVMDIFENVSKKYIINKTMH